MGIRVKRNRLGEIVGREVPHYLALSWFLAITQIKALLALIDRLLGQRL